MKRPKNKPAAAPEEDKLEEKPAEEVRSRIFERPDGFYWQTVKGGDEHGPFTTLAEAEADMESGGESTGDPGDPEALQQAESELGISEWVDPDSGVPAEDSVPRLEDH